MPTNGNRARLLRRLSASVGLLLVLPAAPAAGAGIDMINLQATDGICAIVAQRPDQLQPSVTSVQGTGELSCATEPGAGPTTVTWSVCVVANSAEIETGVLDGEIRNSIQRYAEGYWTNDGCKSETISFGQLDAARVLRDTMPCRVNVGQPWYQLLYRTQVWASIRYPSGATGSLSDASDPTPVTCAP